MTQRDFLNEVVNANLNDEMTTKAKEMIAQLDKANDRKRSATSKAKSEHSAFMNEILKVLAERTQATGAELAETLGVTTSKVTQTILHYGEGRVTKTLEKIEGVKGKKTIYRLATQTDVE